jgi:hypothetical protein
MPTTVQQINLGSYPNDGTGDDLRTAFEKVNSNFNLLFSKSNVTTGINLGGGTGVLFQKNSSTLNLEFKTLTSVDNSVVFNSNNFTVDLLAKTTLQRDLAPRLGANLNLNAFNVYGGDTRTTVYGLDFPITNNLISSLINSNNLVLDLGSFSKPIGYQRFPRSGYNIDLNGTGVGSGFDSPLANDYDFGSLAVQNSLQVGGSFLTLGGNLVTSGGNITINALSGNNSITLPRSGTLISSSDKLNALTATSSSEFGSVISDKTGTGNLVFSTNPLLAGSVTLASGAYLTFADGSTLTSAAGLAGSNKITNGPYNVTLDNNGILNLPVSLRFQDGTVLSSTTNIIPNQFGQSGKFLTTNGSTVSWGTAGTGTVTSVSVASANGFSGTIATGTTTPAITIQTTITGILKGNGTAVSAATSGTDYVAPNSSPTFTGVTISGGSLTFSGAISAPAWTTSGIRHVSSPATLTDTTSTGTVANAYTNNFGGNTIAASNAVTFTNYATVFLNDPVAGTNVTVTNAYSLITAGNVKLGSTGTGVITAVAATATANSTAASVGYLGMPVNSQSGSTYAVVASDLGKVIYFSATCTATVPASLPIGSSIAFVAGTGATVTIAQASDSMYLGGTGTTGSRTLAAFGMATAIKMAATVWFINGTGLT